MLQSWLEIGWQMLIWFTRSDWLIHSGSIWIIKFTRLWLANFVFGFWFHFFGPAWGHEKTKTWPRSCTWASICWCWCVCFFSTLLVGLSKLFKMMIFHMQISSSSENWFNWLRDRLLELSTSHFIKMKKIVHAWITWQNPHFTQMGWGC